MLRISKTNSRYQFPLKSLKKFRYELNNCSFAPEVKWAGPSYRAVLALGFYYLDAEIVCLNPAKDKKVLPRISVLRCLVYVEAFETG
jgi:hypothetical protein